MQMNKYTIITLIALLIVVATLPVYALFEAGRMDQALTALADLYVAEGADMYVSNCANCHGAGGQGVGAMPALNNPALAKADRDILYDTIAHSPHGTVMSAWHVDEGGALNSFQVEGLVTLIMNADWNEVSRLASVKGFREPAPADPNAQLAKMDAQGDDPHECRACHEEPDLHAERFGLNCSRCHTLDAWKPALLLRHTFALDHGGEGQVACQTCHTHNYSANTCYECHDHQPADMQTLHAGEGIFELQPCEACHPTGASKEAQQLGYGLNGRTSALPAPGPHSDNQLPAQGAEIPSLQPESDDPPAPASRQEQAPDNNGAHQPPAQGGR